MGLHRDTDGTFPAYAWPGGYQMIYRFADGEACCPACANGGNGSLASEIADDPDWRLEEAAILYEGPSETCAHCGATIKSAYGDPDSGAA